MSHKHEDKTFECPICHQHKPQLEGRPAELIHGPIGRLIREKHSDWDSSDMICLSCLNKFRAEWVEDILEEQRGKLGSLENEVIDALGDQELLSRNIDPEFEKKLTFGDRMSDRVAAFGGSWRFIILFGTVMTAWIILNSVALLQKPFDPYPYILLNLMLSCLAAIQAPIIMMSQNRQEAKDRARGEHDYQINLKAEIEIRQLHIKLDNLMNQSWQRLLEIQQVQLDLIEDMADIANRRKEKGA